MRCSICKINGHNKRRCRYTLESYNAMIQEKQREEMQRLVDLKNTIDRLYNF